MRPMRHILDIPPVWLLGSLALSRVIARIIPVYLPGGHRVGIFLVLAGVVLLAGAVVQMLAWRTTVDPYGRPTALLTTGLFGLSRNPIYLADVLLLTGLSLWWNGAASLFLVPLLMVILTRRFIRPEEDRLLTSFGAAFDAYVSQTRRWI